MGDDLGVVALFQDRKVGKFVLELSVGFANGTDTAYQLVARALDAFVANEVAGDTSEVDARSAFGSIFRGATQRGVVKLAPELLSALSFLYGMAEVMGRCYFYGRGRAAHLGSCLIPCGVQQGDVFDPLFFALGLDELLLQIRARMRNLPVDSTYMNQPVFAVEGTIGPGGGKSRTNASLG